MNDDNDNGNDGADESGESLADDGDKFDSVAVLHRG